MRERCWSRGLAEARNYTDAGLQEGGWLRHRANQIRQMLRGCDATDMSFDGCRVYVVMRTRTCEGVRLWAAAKPIVDYMAVYTVELGAQRCRQEVGRGRCGDQDR